MADVTLVLSKSGCQFRIRVQPSAKRSAVLGVYGDRLKVAVAAPPTDGRANQEVIELIADELGLALTQVIVKHGTSSRDKTIEIRDADVKEVEQRLSALVGRSE